MNTVTFEYFRKFIEHYLASKKYTTKFREFRDQSGLVTKEVVQVNENNLHIYTINMFTTTSNIMINGSLYQMFIDYDIPIIVEKIDDMAEEIDDANKQTEQHIMMRLAEFGVLPTRTQALPAVMPSTGKKYYKKGNVSPP